MVNSGSRSKGPRPRTVSPHVSSLKRELLRAFAEEKGQYETGTGGMGQ